MCDFLAIKEATNSERGVTSTTTRAIETFIDSINSSVPTIVTMPVKSWVKPWSNPSDIKSISFTTLFIISPWGLLSIYLKGTSFILLKAVVRKSLTVFWVTIFVHKLINHWNKAPKIIVAIRITIIFKIPLKSTLFGPIIKSIPLPIKTGPSNVNVTEKRAQIKAVTK